MPKALEKIVRLPPTAGQRLVAAEWELARRDEQAAEIVRPVHTLVPRRTAEPESRVRFNVD